MSESQRKDQNAREKPSFKLESLRERLDSAESLDDLIFAGPSASEHELWTRCALVPRFDRGLYNDVLALDLDVPPFDGFVAQEGIEPDDAEPKRFRLSVSAKLAYRKPIESRIVKSVIDYNKKHKIFTDVEALALQVAIDPRDAARKFLRLYDRADRQFDLARCAALLAALDDGTTPGDAGIQELRDEYRRHYEARNLFNRDYYLSASYIHRPELENAFDQFVDDPDHWIFHLHAPGGYGKTIALRWLIARHALVPERRYPCARIDFDSINSRALVFDPALLVLPLAVQLDPQVGKRRPFFSLIQETRQLLASLERVGGNDRASLQPPASEGGRGDDFALRFVTALKESAPDTPGPWTILIVLDTLEELILAGRDALLALLEWMARARKEVPGLRLILSGRMDLDKAITGFKERYGAQCTTFSPGRFTVDEAKNYLRRRGLKHDDALLAAIWRRAGKGHPFRLSLFAELALSRGDSLTVQEVRDFPRADVANLMERVVERIEPELQWVVRYGIIPRRLTRSFLAKVLAEPLRRALAGDQSGDAPRLHWPVGTELYRDRGWKPSRDTPINPDVLFDRLKDYAFPRGWVSVLSGPTEESLKFHPSVRRPMRALLRQQPVFLELHNLASAYFSEQAQEAEDRWAGAISEAIYHQFQRLGPLVATFWRSALDDSRSRADPSSRLRIAEEILGSDYAIGEIRPLNPERSPYISRALLAEAHTQAARAAIALGQGQDVRYWSRARNHVERLALVLGPPHTDAERPLDRLMDARKLEDRKDYDSAAAILRDALKTATGDDRLAILIELGDCLALEKDPEAIEFYRAAIDLRARPGDPSDEPKTPARGERPSAAERSEAWGMPASQIRESLTLAYQTAGEYTEAARLIDQAAAEANERGDALARLGLTVRSGELLLAAYQPNPAEALFTEAQAEAQLLNSPGEWFWSVMGRAEVARFRLRPLVALDQLARAEPVSGMPMTAVAVMENRASLLGRLLRINEAIEGLEQAEKQYDDLGATGAASRCKYQQVEIMMDEAGDLRAAARLVQSERRIRKNKNTIHGFGLDCLEIERLASSGDRAAASKDFLGMQSRTFVRRSPTSLARCSLLGLILGLTDDAATTADDLLNALRKINPPSARLAPLRPLGRLSGTLGLDETHTVALLELLPRPGGGPDDIPIDLALVDVLRAAGRTEKAEALAVGIQATCLEHGESFALRKVLVARDRIRPDWASELPDLSDFLKAYEDAPVLIGAALVEQAHRAIEAKHDDIRPLVEQAQAALGRAPTPPTKWHNDANELAASLKTTGSGSGTSATRGPAQPSPGTESPDPVRQPETNWTMPQVPVEVLTVEVPTEGVLSIRWSTLGRPDRVQIDQGELISHIASFSEVDVATQLAGDPEPIRRLGQWFFHSFQGDIPDEEHPRDLRLICQAPGPNAFPWEWLPFGGEGRLASAFRHTYRSAEHPSKLSNRPTPSKKQRRVLVLQPSQVRSSSSRRGRLDTAPAYASAGFSTFTIDNPVPDQIRQQVESLDPDVIHIVSTVQGSIMSKLSLEFAAERGFDATSTSEALSTTLLSYLMSTSEGPLIVVDVPLPPTPSEAFRQVLLRNWFASELFAWGFLRGLLATGLCHPKDQQRFLSTLTTGLADRQSLGEIANRLRFPNSLPGDLTSATALFTDDPNWILWQ